MYLANPENWLPRLNGLLAEVLPANRFQTERLGPKLICATSEDYRKLPFLTKKELVADAIAHPPFGTNLTYPLEKYTYYHQTSGTTGTPLRVLDTGQTWQWWGRCWIDIFRLAGVTANDRLFFAFSFAPSIGFWSSYHGAVMMGALCIPSGGASSVQRLRMILDTGATVLLCTPSYALHLAAVALREGIRLADSQIRITIHAGEPGASIPATRARLEEAWHAHVIDHAGTTEVGPYGLGCPHGHGIHINEAEFIAEVLDSATLQPTPAGEIGELILTNLGRVAWPAFRYRTGDLVRPRGGTCACGSTYLLLEGGILGRADDMITIRGVNVFPSALEDVIRSVSDLAEFRILLTRRGEMDELAIELEETRAVCDEVADRIRMLIGIRVEVLPVTVGSLPRSEGKARRLLDERK